MKIILQQASYLILAITYIGLAIGQIPGLRLNRTTIAFVGAAGTIALGMLDLQEAWLAIDANTIIFLLSNRSKKYGKIETQNYFLGAFTFWLSFDCNYFNC